MKEKLPERRRFVRIEIPLKVAIDGDSHVDEVIIKNISPVGLRFEIGREMEASKDLALTLYLPTSVKDTILLKGRVIWQTKINLEDNASYDVGVEITDIKDNHKNMFLKFLCDLLYDSAHYEVRT